MGQGTMTIDPTEGHTVRAYDRELTQLRGFVLEMGERVIEQTRLAVDALIEGDAETARRVVSQERKIDYMELDADDEVFNLIAKRAPTAIDLRLILALSKVIGDLERAGDKAARVAACAIELQTRGSRLPEVKILHHFRQMAELACRMLSNSLDALARTDVDLALGVFAEDRGLEMEFDAAMRHLITFVFEDASLVGQVIELVFGLKSLERIGNHAGNIAEQVIYIAKGQDVRYQNRENLIAALSQRRR
ncbi:phosphate transport system regulatory protein PhoU [Thiococcus pfennigii]|nr:phosphate transport system regulatory protein PhoU [Thiococcus pfennigii]